MDTPYSVSAIFMVRFWGVFCGGSITAVMVWQLWVGLMFPAVEEVDAFFRRGLVP